MATKKSTTLNIHAPEFEEVEFKIVGDTPLIVHAWDEKAKRQIKDKEAGVAKKTSMAGWVLSDLVRYGLVRFGAVWQARKQEDKGGK